MQRLRPGMVAAFLRQLSSAPRSGKRTTFLPLSGAQVSGRRLEIPPVARKRASGKNILVTTAVFSASTMQIVFVSFVSR